MCKYVHKCLDLDVVYQFTALCAKCVMRLPAKEVATVTSALYRKAESRILNILGVSSFRWTSRRKPVILASSAVCRRHSISEIFASKTYFFRRKLEGCTIISCEVRVIILSRFQICFSCKALNLLLVDIIRNIPYMINKIVIKQSGKIFFQRTSLWKKIKLIIVMRKSMRIRTSMNTINSMFAKKQVIWIKK